MSDTLKHHKIAELEKKAIENSAGLAVNMAYVVTLKKGFAFEPSHCCANALHSRAFLSPKTAMAAVVASHECYCPICLGVPCDQMASECVGEIAERSVI